MQSNIRVSEREAQLMNHTMAIKGHGINGALALNISNGESAYERGKASAEAGKRFVQSAGLLPSDGFIGVQISAADQEQYQLTAFSGGNAKVTKEDIEWIFQSCADAEAAASTESIALCPETGKTYALRRAISTENENGDSVSGGGYNRSYEREQDAQFVRSKELLDEIARTGAVIRFLAPSGGKGQGIILISMGKEMTLRMRTMLARAFSYTAAVALQEDDPAELLPAQCLQEGLAGLLRVLMHDAPSQTDMDDDDIDDEYDADEEYEPRKKAACALTIEELNFSVRTFNVLKRAGIKNAAQLQAMTDEDLRHIRNLGRKCMEEIRQKLRLIESTGDNAQATTPNPCYADMLNELIGLQNVKAQIKRIIAYARMKQDMEQRGKSRIPVVLNMEFAGNPGTAKTTVARIVAGLLHEIGLLSSGEVMEVGRADLVARYVGQTADKVKNVFLNATGKLLFIDEAYSLVEASEGEFGDEAINTIVQEMENNREDTIVIFAGYPDKMEEFLDRNPGLRSRVPFHIVFPDYTAEEMAQIAVLEAEKRDFTICPDAMEKLSTLCAAASRQPELGNGRFCRNLIEDAILSYAERVYGNGDESPETNFALSVEDFREPVAKKETNNIRSIGFNVN